MPQPDPTDNAPGLLGPADIRRLARVLNLRPSKARGQNFVHDAGTVRRIVRLAGVQPEETVLEVGPGLGSLTLALLQAGARVIAVEIEPVLAQALPVTVADRLPDAVDRLGVLAADAMSLTGPESLPVPPAGASAWAPPTRLVANLPYNVAVPVLLNVLAALPDLRTATIMVQAEVADRLAAAPGSRTYGVPSVKAAWYGHVRRDARIGRTVFWPVPNVDSAIVTLTRREPPPTTVTREQTFAVVDAAFAQRRKTLRRALAPLAGGTDRAEAAARAAGIDPGARGENLDVVAFAALAQALGEVDSLPNPTVRLMGATGAQPNRSQP
ncbi:16S rRNA (adenine(1518)-N(6)/adenine(1519)-N(6))-dimethyltransferase RsmA [Actinomyces sp.]|uniref:16S rRNA (adenine(1518)-N(6)/adenine(1519)-N(6))- dimethyltransferase RsmA n=1 Tax=Actinomyces sp. TaxID=29317 RepID=UPI0026DD374C|nr:16S rRNA (adenine(1518)-N(6)/adenine(1519)-N(6))-dimethyltransferase RsmA [Actinomyces sp.]MDO4901109.1 16S rRNA (adenine(1518)-N(6)/adenine(1519)-N(6))-dimethyltransferase RsmA [Actinomyces sp.]